MPLILPKRSLLTYPSGVPAGFDPAHPAAKRILLSAIPTVGNFVNLLNGTRGTITAFGAGGPYSVKEGIGPSNFCSNTTTTSSVQFPNSSTDWTSGTFGLILHYVSTGGAQYFIGNNLTSAGSTFNVDANVLQWTMYGVVAESSGLTLTTNTPYFLIGSQNGSTGINYLVMNLQTGKVVTATSASATPNTIGSTSYTIGSGADTFTCAACHIAAAMYSSAYMPMSAMLQWAADPWAFWYPQRRAAVNGGGAAAYTLTAAAGSYTLTGTAASLLHKYVVSASAGAYTLTGTAATLRRNLPLVAGAGSYTLTGTAASLLHKYVLTAGAGSYTLTGTAATLKHGFAVAAGAGSYTLTGTAAGLLKTWRVAASAGSYVFTGTDATLTYLSGKTLVAGAGSYTLAGTAATLLRKYIVAAGAGSYALSGVAATLRHGYTVTVGAGSYTITGSAAALRRTVLLPASGGSYALTGAGVVLTHGGAASGDDVGSRPMMVVPGRMMGWP